MPSMMDLVNEDPDALKKLKVPENALFSLAFPFDKWLICPSCEQEWKAKDVVDSWKFNHEGRFTYCGPCPSKTPQCGEVEFKVEDRYLRDTAKGLGLIRWPHLAVQASVNPFAPGEVDHYARMPRSIRNQLAAGDKLMASTVPLEVIQACKEAKRIKINRGNLFTLNQLELFAHALLLKVREDESMSPNKRFIQTLLSNGNSWWWAHLDPEAPEEEPK